MKKKQPKNLLVKTKQSSGVANAAYYIGVAFALLAALSNATIGFFTTLGINENLQPGSIAFYRCLIAFIAISLYIFFTRNWTKIRYSYKRIKQIAICSFFGVFILYFFETTAYAYLPVASVTFLLMGSSTILTFFASNYFLGEKKSITMLYALFFVLAGLGLMILDKADDLYSQSLLGCLFAIFSGIGYSLFLLLAKKFKLEHSMQLLWLFFAIGAIYLSVPFLINGGLMIPGLKSYPTLIFLALVPTLGGFYFTTKALTHIEASKTQLFELTEPVFASLIALVGLGQFMSLKQIIGGSLIILGLYISEKKK